MKILKEVELKPISVPNYILVKEDVEQLECQTSKFAIESLDAHVLHCLCTEFRANVFKKCGKKDPLL